MAGEPEFYGPYSRSYVLSDGEMGINWYKIDECVLIPDYISGKYRYIGILYDTASMSYRSGIVYISNTDPGPVTRPSTFMKVKPVPVDSVFGSGIFSVYTPDDLGMKMDILHVWELLGQDTDPGSQIAAGYYREEAESIFRGVMRGIGYEGGSGASDGIRKAIGLYDRVLAIAPDHDSYCRRGALYMLAREEEKALSDFRKALELYPGSRIALSELWRIHYGRGEYGEALKHIRALVESGMRDSETVYRLAKTYHSALDYDSAIVYYKEAVALAPDNLNSHWNLGRIYLFVKEDFDSAVRHFRETVRLNGGYAGNHYLLGVALRHAGLFDEAAASFEKAVAIEPMHREANLLLAEYLLHGKGDPDGAMECLRAALSSEPDDIGALLMLASCFKAKGEYEEALQWLNKAESLAAGDTASAGDAAAAFAAEKAAVYRDMAWHYLLMGDFSSSLDMGLKWVELDDGPISRFHLSLAYIGLGENGMGLSGMLDAMELLTGRDDPEYNEMKERLERLVDMGLVPGSAKNFFECVDLVMEMTRWGNGMEPTSGDPEEQQDGEN